MRDAAKSRDTFPESIRKALTQNNSRMHGILLIIILLSLTAIAGYLAYDILSFGSIGASDGSPSSLQGKGYADAAESWQVKGINLFERGKYNESIPYFDKAIAENSTNSVAWKYKGKALYALGDYQSAIKCCDKALLLNSSDGEALYYKGISLMAMNRSDEARQAFAKAEKLGNWPNPLKSKGSSNANSTKSSGKAAESPSKIVVNWALANSESHSSGGSSSDYYVATPKAVTADKKVSDIKSKEAQKNSSPENNLSQNASNVKPIDSLNNGSTNTTPLDIAEINVNIGENSSTGPSINAAEGNGASKNKVKKAGRSSPISPAKPKEIKARINATKKSAASPKKPLAPKSINHGAIADNSASSTAKVEESSAVKKASTSSSPKPEASAAKKSVKSPVKPTPPKAPATRSKAAGK